MPKKLDIFPVLTVDPGWNTGLAYWEDTKTVATFEINTIKKCTDTAENLKKLYGEFYDVYNFLPEIPKLVIIEGVELWGSSVKSYASTATGNLFKLAYLIGGYTNISMSFSADVLHTPFREWGGQLSPNAVRRWVERTLHQKFDSQHIYDAVAMGLSYFGRFNKNELREM